MKTIDLVRAHKILEDCSGVITDEHVIIYPSLADLTGDDENEFLYLSWINEGADYYVKFNEGCNREVKVVHSSMFLIDDEGDEIQLTVLVPQDLEDDVKIVAGNKPEDKASMNLGPLTSKLVFNDDFAVAHDGRKVKIKRKARVKDGYLKGASVLVLEFNDPISNSDSGSFTCEMLEDLEDFKLIKGAKVNLNKQEIDFIEEL